MAVIKFYKCIGGPLDGGQMSRASGTIHFQSEEGSVNPMDPLIHGGGLEKFSLYTLEAHPEFGHVWNWPSE